MSFDNETVGKLQAESLVKAMGKKGNILMLNGAPTDPNAAQFKKGAHSVIDSSAKILSGGEFDNPDWSADNAQKFVTSQARPVPRQDRRHLRRQRRPGRWRRSPR